MNKEEFIKTAKTFTQEQLKYRHDIEQKQLEEEHAMFLAAYRKGQCVFCGKPFETKSKENPCLHWLLRRCKFRKNDFPTVYKKFGYLNIASYLRWVANEEMYLVNINNMDHLRGERKVFEYSVKWKNIEWTFDCSLNDYAGHQGTKTDYPHYHFQMRIDGQQFINFGDFHVPFNKEDIWKISLSLDSPEHFYIDFFGAGAGMQEALEVPPDDIIKNATVNPSNRDNDIAPFNITSYVNKKGGLDLETVIKIFEESERTGETKASLSMKYFGEDSVNTVISPGDEILPIAKRTERKRR